MPTLTPRQIIPAAAIVEIFSGESTAATRARVIAALSVVYKNSSDKSYKDRTRPDVITEEFSISLPTEAAYTAEIALCDSILQHSAGQIADGDIQNILSTFIQAHTIIHRNGGYEAKVGEYFDWTGKTLDLFYLRPSGSLLFGMTGNVIQCELAKLLEEAAGRKYAWEMRRL